MPHPAQPTIDKPAHAPQNQHPTWCDRRHGDGFPVHAAFIGGIVHGPTLTLTVEIVDYGLGNGPHIHIELADSREPGGDAYQLAAQTARDLSKLLAAGADILSSCIGRPLEFGVPR
ncbi:hypothetical protein [Catellatospora methionotrophica]|uniref:hypothetical protein n=1 Tax=Catellatospora methionotrophica TaxID=121620 RepID=UPI0033E6E5DD